VEARPSQAIIDDTDSISVISASTKASAKSALAILEQKKAELNVKTAHPKKKLEIV